MVSRFRSRLTVFTIFNIWYIAINDKLVIHQESGFDGGWEVVEGLEDFSGGVFDGEPCVFDEVIFG